MTHNGTVKKFRVGVFGAGNVVQELHLPVLTAMPDVEVSWICDLNELMARKAAKDHRIPHWSAEVGADAQADCVLIATPVGRRAALIELACHRGWNVFCEKPFAVTLTEADSYLAIAGRHRVQMGVGLMRRFYPGTRILAEAVASGVFGRLREVWASEGSRVRGLGRDKSWYQSDRTQAGGGVLLETGSHLVDQVLSIVSPLSITPMHVFRIESDGLDHETRVVAVAEIGGGATVNVAFALSRVNDLFPGIVLRFDNAEIHLPLGVNAMPEVRTIRGGAIFRLASFRVGGNQPYQPFYTEWREFIGQCRTRMVSQVDALSARMGFEFIDKCYRFTENCAELAIGDVEIK